MSERNAKASARSMTCPARSVADGRSELAGSDLAALILAIGAGDRRAFRELYDSTSGRLFGLAVRLLNRRDAAEDVLQEAFVRVWMHAGKYDPERGAPMPWLWQILRNAAIDRLRRDGLGNVQIDDLAERLETPAVPIAARVDLTDGLARLGPQKTHLLKLAFVDGYTHEEIAAELGAPLGTIKSKIRRGLEQLRSGMGEDEPSREYWPA